MSHKVSYKWIRKTQVIPEYVVFYKNRGFYLEGVSDCEELVVPPEEASRQKCD
jgi:hypothetical protein